MSPRTAFDPAKKDWWWIREALIDVDCTPYDSPVIEARQGWDHCVVMWQEWVGDWQERLRRGEQPDAIDLHAFLALDQ